MNEVTDVQKISLYPLALEMEQGGLMSSMVQTLLAISHGIEDAVMQNQLRGTFYAGFQRLSAFAPQAERFARLAAACGEVFVFAFPDAPVPQIPKVQFVLLEPEAPLVQEWFIVFSHSDFVASLLTQQVGERSPDALVKRRRVYQGLMTFDPAVVNAARARLDYALDRAPLPKSPFEFELPVPHMTFLSVFTASLEKRNRQVAALYRTLASRAQSMEQLQSVVRTMMSRAAWEDATLVSTQPEQANEEVFRLQTLTVLTTDIQGFTTLNDRMPTEALIDALNRYFDMLATIVYQEHGDVDKFLGDGMLSFFTQPVAALRAALRIQQRVTEFNAQEVLQQRVPFPTRLGLVTGPCLVARIGSRDRQEVTVLGDTVNTSSRLQSLAPTGWVAMDEATYLACDQPSSKLKMVTIRGKEGLQPIYQIFPDEFQNVGANLPPV